MRAVTRGEEMQVGATRLKTKDKPSAFSWREVLWVGAVVGAVSGMLYWRFLPLPHGDLNFFTEPAYWLAHFGKIASPGAQAYDLTFQKGMYCYPPGYFLILAGWLKVFGLSADSLLAYTHIVHASALVLLWVLLRKRYECSRGICALALLAIFPRMAHGRPDLTAVALSIAAWLALPEEFAWGRLVLSGCLAGAALLVSQAFGIAIVSTLLILLLIDQSKEMKLRLRDAAIWASAAGLTFGVVTAAVLTWQQTWIMAYVQFKTNATLRGGALNVWPDFHLVYTWAFCVVPFFLLAVLPAVLAGTGLWKDAPKELRNVSIAFLGSAALWLMLDHHFLYPSKIVFLGIFFSWPKLPAWLRVTPLALLCFISFYYYKSDFLYLGTPLRLEERSYAAGVRPEGIVEMDSLYFPRFYRPGETLDYGVAVYEGFWESYREAIPAYARKEMLAGLPDKPMVPNMLMVSADIASMYGDKPTDGMACEQPKGFTDKLRVLGRTWNVPAHPYALMVCHRR
jgi:hypothetical protein